MVAQGAKFKPQDTKMKPQESKILSNQPTSNQPTSQPTSQPANKTAANQQINQQANHQLRSNQPATRGGRRQGRSLKIRRTPSGGAGRVQTCRQNLRSDFADSEATGTQPLPPAPAKVWFHFNVFSSPKTNWIFH